ncbi:MAG: hypothetical protein HZR80_14325 [Candidatus Heimdallarchaeota archaeon]
MSLALYGNPYNKLFWPGTFLTIFLTLIVYLLLLFGWEKIKYIGSLEWFIRTFTNNVVPARKQKFDSSVKWWQKGLVDVEGTFYNPEWIDLVNPEEDKVKNEELFLSEKRDSKLALILSIVGLVTIVLNAASIFGLFVSLNARKIEGRSKLNNAALIISIIGCVFFVTFYTISFIIKIGALGLPL